MAFLNRKFLQMIYRRAGSAEKLPWHREVPPGLLVEAVNARGGKGRAVDVGCGSGVFTVWMARQGLEATGIDFLPEAVAMARARAEREGVKIDVVQASVLEWAPERPVDLVFDSGCLHTLAPSERPAYKRQLLRWLGPGGDYLLGHFGRRHALDWRPIGPRRRTRDEIVAEMAPELELREEASEEIKAGLPIGPRVRLGTY